MKNQIINFVAIITIVISFQSCIGPAHLGSERTFVDRPRAARAQAITATAKYNNAGSYAGNAAKNISGEIGITCSENLNNNGFVQVGGDLFMGNISRIKVPTNNILASEGGSYLGFSGRLEFGINAVQTEKYRLGIAAITGGSIERGALHGYALDEQGEKVNEGAWFSQLAGVKADFTYMIDEKSQVGLEAVVGERFLVALPIGEYYHFTGFATVKKMTYFVQGSYSPQFSYRPIASLGVGYKF